MAKGAIRRPSLAREWTVWDAAAALLNMNSTLEKRSRISTRLRRYGFVAAVFLLLTPTTLWLVSSTTEHRAMEELAERSEQRLRNVVRRVEAELQRFELLPWTVARNHLLIKLIKDPRPGNVQAVNRDLAELSTRAGATAIYVMDVDGKTLAASNWASQHSFVGKSYGFRSYFLWALSGRTGSQIALGVTSGTLGYYVARPVVYEGETLGVVVVKVALGEKLLPQYSDGSGLIVSDHLGVVFMATFDDWRLKTLTPLADHVLQQIRESRQYPDAPLDPLPILDSRDQEGYRLITLQRQHGGAHAETYLVSRVNLPLRGWRLLYLSPTARIPETVRTAMLITALVLVILLLVVLYLMQRRQHLRQLLLAAIVDPLTGLFTRRHMIDVATMLVNRHHRDPQSGLAAVMYDIDHFKLVNDRYGHGAGDNALKAVANVMTQNVRKNDVAVRFGGEEILTLLAIKAGDHVTEHAERVRKQVALLRFPPPLDPLRLTISAGIAYHRVGESVDELIERADNALYDAKKAGRNTVRIFESTHDAEGSGTRRNVEVLPVRSTNP